MKWCKLEERLSYLERLAATERELNAISVVFAGICQLWMPDQIRRYA